MKNFRVVLENKTVIFVKANDIQTCLLKVGLDNLISATEITY